VRREREKKPPTPSLGDALSSVVRTAIRRARGEPEPLPPEAIAEARDPVRPLDLAEERAASRDLLAIDSLLRRYYALLSAGAPAGGWAELQALFHPGARVGTGEPKPGETDGVDEAPVEQFVEAERAREARPRLRERSRTVHVLGTVAVVISAFDADGGRDSAAGGVNVFQLRRSPDDAWRIQSVLLTAVARAITEKSADPRARTPAGERR
jgi:hypothetical protein